MIRTLISEAQGVRGLWRKQWRQEAQVTPSGSAAAAEGSRASPSRRPSSRAGWTKGCSRDTVPLRTGTSMHPLIKRAAMSLPPIARLAADRYALLAQCRSVGGERDATRAVLARVTAERDSLRATCDAL